MYSKSRFGAVLEGLSRGGFDRLVQAHATDKHSKGFGSWDHLLAMLYSQLAGCRSLRDIESGFNEQTRHHYHLGTRPIRRSTLADANRKRSPAVFEQLCGQLMASVRGRLKAEMRDLLYLIDSTPIPLKGKGYDDWVNGQQGNRTQGLKVHLMIASGATSLPVAQVISAANINDIDVGRGFSIETGATYVFDKGYYDYNWWHRLDEAGAVFVTRLKRNASVERIGTHSESADTRILIDECIQFRNKRPGGQRINRYHGRPLRRVVVTRPDKPTPLVLVTNDFQRPAEVIAELYKQRWEIELFFKWLKQNLKIKRFLGQSENAVKIQLYTALIAYLLVYHYRQRHGETKTLALVLSALRVSLFSRHNTDTTVSQRERRQREYMAELQPSLLPA